MDAADDQISATRQIIAHIGGMMLAFIRHHPINWTFHWSGIRRAISSGGKLPQKWETQVRRKSNSLGISLHID